MTPSTTATVSTSRYLSFAKGDRIVVDGRPASITDVRGNTLLIVYRDAWYWRAWWALSSACCRIARGAA